MLKTRCVSTHPSDFSTEDVNEYIRDTLQIAREARDVPGILDKREDSQEELERIAFLSKALPLLQNMKNHPFAQNQNVDIVRQGLDTIVPFRGESCVGDRMTCCGSCSRMCFGRCVQDILNTISMKAFNIYVGITSREEATAVERACFDVLMWPNATYSTLNTAMQGVISENRKKGVRHCADYAPYLPRNGNHYVNVNKETGKIDYVDWPGSGLCPYCMPSTTYYRYSDATRAQRAQRAIQRGEEYQKRMDGTRKRGRPRKDESINR